MGKAFGMPLSAIEAPGDGWVLVPFGFTINGTTTPDGLSATLASVTYDEAGEFTCALHRDIGKPACIYGRADVCVTADDTDLQGEVDWSTVESAGTFKVRTMTGAVQTDPADNSLVGGFLFCKKNQRTLF